MSSTLSIGVAGWSYPDWKGIVYPRGIKDPLHYLCKYVDCIEINSTFYRPPDVNNSRRWLDRTARKDDFFFTAKLHRDFTHEHKIDSAMVKQFHDGLAITGQKILIPEDLMLRYPHLEEIALNSPLF